MGASAGWRNDKPLAIAAKPAVPQNTAMSDTPESEFKRLMREVKPIKHDRVNLLPERTKKQRPKPAILDDSGGYETTNQGMFPAVPAEPSYFDSGLQRKQQSRIRSGAIRPEATIDLHGLRVAKARTELDSFITAAGQRGCRMLLVVHGQGYGSTQAPVLKPMVFQQLATRSDILAWCPAQPRDGAGGATYVYLRQK